MGKTLYVSDNRSDQLFSVEPADFLKSKKPPKITVVFKGKGVFPNGLYPGKGGALLMVGFEGKDKPHGIYEMAPGKEPKPLSDKIGMLDGLYHMKNGDIIATDWVSGSRVPVEQEDGQEGSGHRVQRSGRFLRRAEQAGSLGGRARSGERRNPLRAARQVTSPPNSR